MRIRIAENFRAVFYAPFYAAQALGFYAREGAEVELVNSSVAGDGVAALLAGTVDLTWGGPMRVIKARDQNADSPLVCFCEVVASDPFFLIGKSTHAEFQLVDLAGMRFATVSEVPTPWLCLQQDLRLHGIDPSRLPRIADRTMAENFTALSEAKLDVIQVFEPYVSRALRADAGRILYAASTRGPTSYTTFIATRPGIARRRAGFAGVTRAMDHMRRWLGEHNAEELAAVTASFFPNVPREALVSSFQRYHDASIWACTPDVSRVGIKRLAESLLSGDFIARLPKYEDCVAQRLVE
jgi:NitT/TauT family transport system substrate-binding protein